MEQNQVEVEILTQTITAQYGTLAQGDKLRTSPEFAKHLVEDAKAARYTSEPRKGASADDGSADADQASADAANAARSTAHARQTSDPERHGTSAKSSSKK
jgi:hypothetical protein